MSYQIGQYRYSSDTQYSTNIPVASTEFIDINSNFIDINSSDSSVNFKDVIIKPKFSAASSNRYFDINKDYHLRLALPKSPLYKQSFNIKLVKSNEKNFDSVYQFLTYVAVDKQFMSNADLYRVALYETTDEHQKPVIQTAIPVDLTKTPIAVEQRNPSQLYYAGNSQYLLGKSEIPYTKVVDTLMAPTWIDHTNGNVSPDTSFECNMLGLSTVDQLDPLPKEGTDKIYVDLLFQPWQIGFDAILIEMVRTAEDYDIRHVDEETLKVSYGRELDIKNTECEIEEIQNIVPKMTGSSEVALSHIAIWGQPGQMFSINGEEISLGRNGMFELTNVIPVMSIGVIIRKQDKAGNPVDPDTNAFSIDYRYQTLG